MCKLAKLNNTPAKSTRNGVMDKQHPTTKIISYLFICGILANIFFMFTFTSLKEEERLTQAIFTGKKIIFTSFHNDFNLSKNFTRLNLPLFVTDRNTPKVLTLFRAHFGTPDQDADFAGSCSVKLADLNIVHSLFKLIPGSSGLPPRA